MSDIAKKLLARRRPSDWIYEQAYRWQGTDLETIELTNQELSELLAAALRFLDIMAEKLDMDFGLGWQPEGLEEGPTGAPPPTDPAGANGPPSP